MIPHTVRLRRIDNVELRRRDPINGGAVSRARVCFNDDVKNELPYL
jgi:hypothetical protein